MVTILSLLLIHATVVAASQNTAQMAMKVQPSSAITASKPVNNLPIVFEVHANDGFAHVNEEDSVSDMRYAVLTQEDLRSFQPDVWFKTLLDA
ncbi:hypothetical protein PRIPAC_96056 [Pristionchus pacificus]|uniref:Uncharacterized protein n=1 Tax=Pristionchus pacificus TaxID=54126 RepID=A0A2A6D274_PRIPA|nr:hypothetical protein PRIPAC_96056 [Pristionchus pacificus]|eukprot:PDM84534.1 hypothetical protein PRIPAC_33557 [Pristionchus pacificus]